MFVVVLVVVVIGMFVAVASILCTEHWTLVTLFFDPSRSEGKLTDPSFIEPQEILPTAHHSTS